MNSRTSWAAAAAAMTGAAAIIAMFAACAPEPTLPTATPGAASLGAPRPAGASELTTPPSAPAEAPPCGDATASLRPAELPQPGQMPAGSTMAKIVGRGALRVGVDQNTFNFGFRNPFSGNIEGFEIDMAKHIARAIFGDPNKVQFKILTSAQRIDALKEDQVDIVVRTFTINCERLQDINFSTVYYEAKQRVLVKKGSGFTGIETLAGKRVCAARESTSLRNIANASSKPVAVSVPNWTDCLVMLQQGQVDAVSTDDTILAGFVAQDPFTEIVGPPLFAEPYGIGIPKGNEDLVRFVNGVLEQLRANGTWTATYNTWLADLLGTAPAPPTPRYRD